MTGENGILGMINRFHHKSGWQPVKVISVTGRTAVPGSGRGPLRAPPRPARGSARTTNRDAVSGPIKEGRPGAGEDNRAPKGIECICTEEHAGVVLRHPCLRPDFLPGRGLPFAAQHSRCVSTPLQPIPPAARPCATSLLPAEFLSAGQPPCSACPCGSHSATHHKCEPVRKDPELL